jgi:hypothetical protein
MSAFELSSLMARAPPLREGPPSVWASPIGGGSVAKKQVFEKNAENSSKEVLGSFVGKKNFGCKFENFSRVVDPTQKLNKSRLHEPSSTPQGGGARGYKYPL